MMPQQLLCCIGIEAIPCGILCCGIVVSCGWRVLVVEGWRHGWDPLAQSSTSETKRATLAATVTMSGEVLPPLLIFKGKQMGGSK